MIPLIILLLLIPLPTIGDLTAEYAEVTCTPVFWPPYYDCSEPLFIVIWDTRYTPWYDNRIDEFYWQENATSLAIAMFDVEAEDHQPFEKYNLISLGNTHSYKGYGDYDEPHETVLWHEIKHILCKCGWHPK